MLVLVEPCRGFVCDLQAVGAITVQKLTESLIQQREMAKNKYFLASYLCQTHCFVYFELLP